MMRPAIPVQIAKLLPLLSSDQDGEVVAAARAVCRTLQAAGLDIHDLARAAVSTPRPRAKRKSAPSWQAPVAASLPGQIPSTSSARRCRSSARSLKPSPSSASTSRRIDRIGVEVIGGASCTGRISLREIR